MRKLISVLVVFVGIFLVAGLFGCQQNTTQSASEKTGQKASLPAAFPDNFPIYKGAKLMAATQDLDVSGKPLYIATWESNNAVAQVLSFYDQALAGNGWLITKKIQLNPAVRQYDFIQNDSDKLPSGSLRIIQDAKTGKTGISVKIIDKSS